MDPQYRFCTSADGTKIAFSTLGRGPRTPIVNVESWAASQDWNWRQPTIHANDESYARDRYIVRFDRRGVGASQRSVEDLSLEAHVADLRAVVEQLEFEHVDLVAGSDGNVVALAYAAGYPQQVRRLILWGPFASGADVIDSGQSHGLAELIRSNWELATRTIANVIAFPSGPVDVQREFAKQLRQSISSEVAARYVEFWASVDVSALLPEVVARTLIFHQRESQLVPTTASRTVAELVPNARLVEYSSENVLANWEQHTELERDFLSEEPAETPSGTAIILFADIADSTALTERLGDAAFRDKARELDEALRNAITSNAGKAIDGKLLGDGVLATFGAAREAIACAQAIHAAGSYAGLPLHVGIHAGDVIREANNVYGGAVNIAARVAGGSAAGETLVSGTVRDLARTSAGVSFEDRGERELKGVGEPVRVYEVRPGNNRQMA